MSDSERTKIWANSGDSHYMEPPHLWDEMPAHLRDRMPRTVRDEARGVEVVTVDGQSFEWPIPKPLTAERLAGIQARPLGEEADVQERAPGALDPELRLKDLDQEGVWAEAIYPSLGQWSFRIRTPEVVREGARICNEFFLDFQNHSPRYVVAATIPMLDVNDAAAEINRASALGFKLGYVPPAPPRQRPPWQDPEWDPMWAAFAENGMVIGIHIGGSDESPDPKGRPGLYHRGRGGAVLNYTENTYGGQRAVTQLIACGALDRHPDLRVLVSEGGATWGPFLADRMDEAYRQHGAAVRPRLSKLPSQYVYEQVYASFQHDRSAVQANMAMGWKNVMWGWDYPHFEGTFGHSQKTLHELFDDVPADVSHRMRIGAFRELFPQVPAPPAD